MNNIEKPKKLKKHLTHYLAGTLNSQSREYVNGDYRENTSIILRQLGVKNDFNPLQR